MIQLFNGDCLEELKGVLDNSIDSIVTDPPYGLSFMGKKWDYQVPSVEIWKECLRVLKPGGHLLSFAGSRTYHRMAVNIEDAGFEIRDQIMWVYGSGFPKSLNIGKAVDKLQGNEREVVGEKITGEDKNIEGEFRISKKTHKNKEGKVVFNITKGNSPWEGWGTGLKPAHEHIVVARKPISEKNIAENVLKWGTGGINIDGCRVEPQDEKDLKEIRSERPSKTSNLNNYSIHSAGGLQGMDRKNRQHIQGRFPANFIHDGSEEVLALFPDRVEGKENFKHSASSMYGSKTKENSYNGQSKSSYGSAARFFYCAKASKSERNAGLEGFEEKASSNGDKWTDMDRRENNKPTLRKNHHPTVKPIKLMQYLVKLVTPPNGTCLDPFMGSGSTGIACKKEGFIFFGIEKEKEYFEIAKARIENTK